MDYVAFADAKVILVAGMAAILLETDDDEKLRKVFEECLPKAKDAYAAELNAVVKRRNEGLAAPEGPAVTRQYWMGMISKIYNVLGEAAVRQMFETMLNRVKEQKQH